MDVLILMILIKTEKSYLQSKVFAKKNKIKSLNQWKNYIKKNSLFPQYPINPESVYQKKGWISRIEFFGKGRVFKVNLSYNQLKKKVSKYNLKSVKAWEEFVKSKKFPSNFPKTPQNVYKKKGEWKGFHDFLNIPNFSTGSRNYYPLEKLKEIAKKNKIYSQNEYKIFYGKAKNPRIPFKPYDVFKNEWKGWPDFFYREKEKYLKYTQAKNIVKRYNFKDSVEFYKFVKKKYLGDTNQ